jgi:integrase
VKHGSVYQRHSRRCPRDAGGQTMPHRCKGTWAYQIDHVRDTTGKRKQITKGGFPTKAAAKAALQEMVAILMADLDTHALTVGQYLDDWLAGKHALKPKTVAVYRDAIELYLRPHLGAIRLLELRAHHLDRFYAAISIGRRGRPLSPSSIRRVHAVLRSALSTAVKRRLIPYNPAAHVELAPENPKRPKPWSVDQCQAFLQHVEADRLSTLYHLMLVTGLRRGEAVGLRWEDVDLESRCLFVVQQITEVRGRAVVGTPKTKRGSRVVPVDQATAQLLRRQREAQGVERTAWGEAWNEQGLAFTREDGRPLRPEYVTRHFQALTKEAGLPIIRLHDLRHTNASIALAAGVDLKVVSDRLGHSTTAITADLYTHVSRGVGRVAAEKIAEVLTAKVGAASDTDASAMPAHEALKGPERSSDETSLQVDDARPKGLEPLTF